MKTFRRARFWNLARCVAVFSLVPLTATLVLAGCDGEIDGEDNAVIGKLVVSPELQLDVVNQVYIPVVELNRTGWVAVWTDAGGARGELLGQTFIEQEVALNVDVPLTRDVADGDTLHATLHVDRGQAGVFEPEADSIVTDEAGAELDRTFQVFFDVDSITQVLVVSNQSYHPIDDDLSEARVDEVAVRQSGWVAIYADEGFNDLLGAHALSPGTSRRVDIELSRDINDGETLYARVHVETSNPAQFDPGVDVPLMVDGGPLTGSFVVTIEDVVFDPELDIEDQTAAPANQVVVTRAVSRGQGWVVIYADDGAGAPGDELGSAALSDGENLGVVVALNRDAVDQEVLIGQLFEDAGEAGTWEPGVDPSMQRDDNDVRDSFTVTVDATIMPAIDVTNIGALDDLSTVLVVPSATSVGPGWVVIHEDDGSGAPGATIGQTSINAGTSTDITVMLERPVADGEMLHAMLHEDAGAVGTWEPGTDAPVSDMNGIVMGAFSAAVPAGTPAVRITVTAMDNSDYQINTHEPTTVASPIDGGGGLDPGLTFTEGWRYEIVNEVTGPHPFEFLTGGAMAPTDDVVQASQVTAGPLESDVDVNWVEAGNSMVFTATASFGAAVDTYRCEIHPMGMRGSVTVAAP